ncbi:MAG: phosphoribosylglycinamide formyltransferase [Gammaproteobacteria bacterium]
MPIAVLISGYGSNLQAIIDAIQNGLPVRIAVVISNRADAYGLQRAQQAHIPTHVINHHDYPEREAYDAALQQCLERYQPRLIVLAGFMRILSTNFVQHFRGRLINIHPSLLPKYPGLNTHRQVLAAGDREHGVSVHFVTEAVDSGPLIAQVRLEVEATDTPDTLQQKIHRLEHRIYPEVIRWFAEKRLILRDNVVYLDGQPLPTRGYEN